YRERVSVQAWRHPFLAGIFGESTSFYQKSAETTTLFVKRTTKDEDFLAFERVVEETLRTRRMRLCAYCLMPNHWHSVVWPERDGDL
ncbi:MAG: hypothetical protein WBX00_28850, partial [Isosphaeraceae bacterium]